MVKGGSVVKPFRALTHLMKKPHTIRYPSEEHRDMDGVPLPDSRYRGFHTNDILKCIGCGMCGNICMNKAITYVTIPELKDIAKGTPRRPVVDYGRCCYCGLCTEVCPTGSLKLVPVFEHISPDIDTFKLMPTPADETKKGFKLDISTEILTSRENFEEKIKETIERLKNAEKVANP